MLIVRTLHQDEIETAADLTARIFAEDHEREGMFKLLLAAYEHCPFMRPEDCFVGEVDGRLVAKWQLLNFQMRMAGEIVPFGGIQGVAAEKDENHKGYAKRVALGLISANQEGPFDFALGYGQRGAFYRRIGAVPVAADYHLELDARQIPVLKDDPFRVWDEGSDLPAVIETYNRANVDRTGPLIRTEKLWPWLVRRPPSIYICDEGYLGVIEREDSIEVREVMGTGAAFYEKAVRKLGALARKKGQRLIAGGVPPNHPLVDAAVAYGAKSSSTYNKKSGCLAFPFAPLRLLERFTGKMSERIRDSRHHDTQIDLGIRCGEKSSRLLINAEGRSSTKIDLELSPGAALQVAFGFRSIEGVLLEEATSDIRSGLDAQALELLGVLFPTGHPFMWNADRY